MISVSGAGDDMTDLDFTADRCAWFEAGSRRWFELTGPYRERRVALRVARATMSKPPSTPTRAS